MKTVSITGCIPNHSRFYITIAEIFKTEKVILNCTKEVSDVIADLNIDQKITLRIHSLVNLYKNYNYGDITIVEQPYTTSGLLDLCLKSTKETYLICHNINTWFFPIKNFRKGIRVRTLIDTILIKIIVWKTWNYTVVSDKLQRYIAGRIPNKNFIHIPFDLTIHPIDQILKKKKDYIKIVIPGTVSKIRDYDMIIDLIEKNKFNKEKIEFVFLGRFIGEYGNKIKVKLSKLKAFGFIISTFTQYIPARSYEREILSADYILTAFKPNYITPAGVNEFIGVTKETGVPYIAFTYQKKAIIPSYYSIPDLIAENVFQYDGIEDLSTFLSKSLLNKKTDTQLFGSSIVKKNKILGNLRNIFELNI